MSRSRWRKSFDQLFAAAAQLLVGPHIGRVAVVDLEQLVAAGFEKAPDQLLHQAHVGHRLPLPQERREVLAEDRGDLGGQLLRRRGQLHGITLFFDGRFRMA